MPKSARNDSKNLDDYFEVSDIENIDNRTNVLNSKNPSGILKKSTNESYEDTNGSLIILN